MSEEVKNAIKYLRNTVHSNKYSPMDDVTISKINTLLKYIENLESLEAKLKIAEGALEFYADKENFTHRKLNGLSGFDCALVEEVAIINGEYAWIKAQQALAKIRGEG